jgi:hypothetical protein
MCAQKNQPQKNELENKLCGLARSGQVTPLKKLLKKGGVNINFQDDEKKLNFWCDGVLRGGDWRNTKPRLPGASGNTPLMWALHLHRKTAAETLLDAGANPGISNLIGETALHLVDENSAHLIDKMVAAGARVNAGNLWGATPLMLAIYQGHTAVALKLMENGALLQQKTPGGLDALTLLTRDTTFDSAFVERVKALEAQANYINDLKTHDWFYAYSDDQRVWRAGGEADKVLRAAQEKLDPDYQLWNKFAPKDYQHKDVVLTGHLEVFSETGTEGTVWAFHEDGKEGMDGLHILKPGDLLSVFNDAAQKKKIWKGVVDFDYEKNKQPLPLLPSLTVQWIKTVGTVHGLQKGVAPQKWAKMFLEEKPAQLILYPSPKPGTP